MTQLRKIGTSILTQRNTLVVKVDPRRAEAVLIAQGMDSAVAREVAFGGDLTAESAVTHDASRRTTLRCSSPTIGHAARGLQRGTSAMILDIPQTALPTCPTCNDDGRLCWDCGSLDQPAIGRKILYLMHHDRPTLLRILSGTPRRQWALLAQAYCAALGTTDQGQAVPALGVVSLWGMLVKEAT